jgi:hypothetical protein
MLKALMYAVVAALAGVGAAWVWNHRRDVRRRLAAVVRKGGRRAQRASSRLAKQVA